MNAPRPEQAPTADRFPVSVVMERRNATSGRWTFPRWQAVSVVAGHSLAAGRQPSSLIRKDAETEQHLWTGFTVVLHKDSSESYWYNLVGKAPSLFVVCRNTPEGALAPFTVSANYDEAGAYMEADEAVFSVAMPAEVYQWLEQYVVANFKPQERKQRKRKNWLEEAEHVKQPRRSGGPR